MVSFLVIYKLYQLYLQPSMEELDNLFFVSEYEELVEELSTRNNQYFPEQQEQICANCELHGNPCLNCAEYVYRGEMGPGYLRGNRIVPYDTGEEILHNMTNYANNNNIEYNIVELYWWYYMIIY